MTSKNYIDTGKLKLSLYFVNSLCGGLHVRCSTSGINIKIICAWLCRKMMTNIISLNFNLVLVNSNIISQFIHKSIIKTHFNSLEMSLIGIKRVAWYYALNIWCCNYNETKVSICATMICSKCERHSSFFKTTFSLTPFSFHTLIIQNYDVEGLYNKSLRTLNSNIICPFREGSVCYDNKGFCNIY